MITVRQVAAYEVPMAPVAEQRRIVAQIDALFAEVNRAKERLDRVPLILKRFRQAVLAAACSGELTVAWRESRASTESARSGRDIQASHPLAGRIRNTAALVPRRSATWTIPRGWCETTIGDVTQNLDSLRKPINREERATRVGTVPYYGANGQVGVDRRAHLRRGFALVVEDETFIGREKPFSYVIRGKSWVNNHAHVLRPLGGMSAEYLNCCLSYGHFRCHSLPAPRAAGSSRSLRSRKRRF